MIAQDYEYIRQQLITATADLSGSTKGQLVAFAENAQLATNRYKRKRLKVRDEETGDMITLHNPPLPGVQSRAKGSSIALVLPVEYATASWRRAVLALDEVECAWLLWCYSENIRYAHQVEIVRWGWEIFSEERKDSVSPVRHWSVCVRWYGWRRRTLNTSYEMSRKAATKPMRWRRWLG